MDFPLQIHPKLEQPWNLRESGSSVSGEEGSSGPLVRKQFLDSPISLQPTARFPAPATSLPRLPPPPAVAPGIDAGEGECSTQSSVTCRLR